MYQARKASGNVNNTTENGSDVQYAITMLYDSQHVKTEMRVVHS